MSAPMFTTDKDATILIAAEKRLRAEAKDARTAADAVLFQRMKLRGIGDLYQCARTRDDEAEATLARLTEMIPTTLAEVLALLEMTEAKGVLWPTPTDRTRRNAISGLRAIMAQEATP